MYVIIFFYLDLRYSRFHLFNHNNKNTFIENIKTNGDEQRKLSHIRLQRCYSVIGNDV